MVYATRRKSLALAQHKIWRKTLLSRVCWNLGCIGAMRCEQGARLSEREAPLGSNRRQGGVKQTLWIALALCCRLEDAFG
jgi:hypothetical protein